MIIYLNYKIINFEGENIGGIISALKKLSSKGILLSTDIEKIEPLAKKIFDSEQISFINSAEYRYFIDLTEDKKYFYNNNSFDTLEAIINSIEELNRVSFVERNTSETKIKVKVNLDGTGKNEINTGIGFFDHMLQQIARHGNIDLEINVKGDLNVDFHHTVEDTGLALGEAILKALGNKIGIKRYGFLLPMDESITKFALDLGGRAFLNFKCKFKNNKVGSFPTELTEEFFKSLAGGLKANIYIRCKGKNDHHKIESIFKAFAKSLNEACRLDERAINSLPSTKGIL